MRVQRVGYRIRGFYRVAALGHLWEMPQKSPDDDWKSRASLTSTAWRPPVTLSACLAARSSAGRPPSKPQAATQRPWPQNPLPQEAKNPKTDPRLVSEIRRLRALDPNLGKARAPRAPCPMVHPAWHRAAQRLDDAIERFRDGMRRNLVTFIDPVSHFAPRHGPVLRARQTHRPRPRAGPVLAASPPEDRAVGQRQ
jgi:hypothetical protein